MGKRQRVNPEISKDKRQERVDRGGPRYYPDGQFSALLHRRTGSACLSRTVVSVYYQDLVAVVGEGPAPPTLARYLDPTSVSRILFCLLRRENTLPALTAPKSLFKLVPNSIHTTASAPQRPRIRLLYRYRPG